ncbi:DNA mismatch repair protein MutS [Pedobacter sp. SYP-B3415]|uniref:MutS-related protein n=1 Tax=Pedobacter sp. SYP-B3415 TaxID=2496641 RepID=UPI00101BA2CE|nr:DNA mismatch repair protein MutS [Pedobacter sp. SYP-B3415]
MLKPKVSALQDYEAAVEALEGEAAILKRRINRFSLFRLLSFSCIIAVFVLVFRYGSWEWAAVSSLFPLILFVQIIRRQAKLAAQDDFQNRLIWTYKNEIALCNGQPNGYDNGLNFVNEGHPYLSDLDIFGPGSVYERFNRCTGSEACRNLAEALSEARSEEQIRMRQEAIAELIPRHTESFRFRAFMRAIDPGLIDDVERQLGGRLRQEMTFLESKLLRGYTRLVPYLMGGLFIFAIYVEGAAWSFFGMAALLNATIVLFNMRSINNVHAGFGRGSAQLQAFSEAISWLEDGQWKSPLLTGTSAAGSAQPASAAIRRLAVILRAFDARLNMLVGGFLNMMALWDIRCCFSLSTWLDTDSAAVTGGFRRVAAFEEFISFSTLAANHPDWTLPVIKNEFCFRAAALAHPLIDENLRIPNDFVFADHPVADLITGSNMAGKSTFLRTVGVNIVLAYAGAHVCADRMELSVFNLFTYMRIRDSLNDRTSTFKAELNRLKMILKGVQRQRRPLVLIDEMLRGTNSRDKYLGSKVFLENLIATGTPVLFATHDLQLASLEEEYSGKVRNFHFDIQISQGDMRFDYKLKSGPCRIFNAALLLQEIGLAISPGANDLREEA